MKGFDLDRIPQEERTLVRVLVKNNLITDKAVKAYMEFLDVREDLGKAYLGELLIQLKYITQTDLDGYIEENRQQHLQFCEKLAQKGFLSQEQKEMIFQKQKETGRDVISLLTHLNIMTRDVFSRIYNQQLGVLRLGEWLVLKKKVTEEQIERARKLQKVNGLEDFLPIYGYISEKTIKLVKEKIAVHSS